MRHYNPQQKQRNRLLLLAAIFASIISFVLFSDTFEKTAPTVTLLQTHWNPSSPLEVIIEDNIAIKNYKATLVFDNKKEILESANDLNQNKIVLKLLHPHTKTLVDGNAQLHIEATDNSYWKFGNKTLLIFEITIDKKLPQVNIIGQSFSITNGGSAVVVFEARDEHLNSIEIVTKNGRTFKPSKFYKDGYYSALIARDNTDMDFAAFVVAKDKAGNSTKKRIPYFLKETKYRYSKLEITNRFLEGKIEELHYQFDKQNRDKNISKIDKFLFVNEPLRLASSDLIAQYSKNSTEYLENFNISPFTPLPNSKPVGFFGDKRDFVESGKIISNSYHLGLDLASIKTAKIFSTNGGKVVFAGENGIYGNTVMIDHGFGLNSIYGHCTDIFVQSEDIVKPNAVIATTGDTGFAYGDHLHFELRIGAVAVLPIEWMDKNWIRSNITKVLDDAKQIIDGRDN